jgi:hypothetical protein
VAQLPAADREQFLAIARRLQILTKLEPRESVAVRDGLDESPQMHMQRGLFSHGQQRFTTDWKLKGPLFAAAWPGTAGELELQRLYPERPRERRQLVVPEQSVTVELILLER